GGGAATLGDVYNFVERKPNGWQHGARRYLGNACLGDALLAFKLDEGGVAAALFPATELQGTQVGDVVAGMDGQSEGVHPFVMGEFESACRRWRGRSADAVCSRGGHALCLPSPIEPSIDQSAENANDLTTTGTTFAG